MLCLRERIVSVRVCVNCNTYYCPHLRLPWYVLSLYNDTALGVPARIVLVLGMTGFKVKASIDDTTVILRRRVEILWRWMMTWVVWRRTKARVGEDFEEELWCWTNGFRNLSSEPDSVDVLS